MNRSGSMKKHYAVAKNRNCIVIVNSLYLRQMRKIYLRSCNYGAKNLSQHEMKKYYDFIKALNELPKEQAKMIMMLYLKKQPRKTLNREDKLPERIVLRNLADKLLEIKLERCILVYRDEYELLVDDATTTAEEKMQLLQSPKVIARRQGAIAVCYQKAYWQQKKG